MNNRESINRPLVTVKIRHLPVNAVFAVWGILFALFLALGAIFFAPLVMVLVTVLGIFITFGSPKLFGLTNRPAVQIGLGIITVSGVLISVFITSEWLVFLAGLGIFLSFTVEMFRSAQIVRRIEQIAGFYLTALLIISAMFWAFAVTTVNGVKITLVFAIVIAVVSLLYFWKLRAVFLFSIINGLAFGIVAAYLIGISAAIGVIAGLSVSLAYRITVDAFSQTRYSKPILPMLAYIALPVCIIGFLPFALSTIFI